MGIRISAQVFRRRLTSTQGRRRVSQASAIRQARANRKILVAELAGNELLSAEFTLSEAIRQSSNFTQFGGS